MQSKKNYRMLYKSMEIDGLTNEQKAAHYDTWQHKYALSVLMHDVAQDVMNQGINHDNSKLQAPIEATGYADYGPKLSSVPFNSTEFKRYISDMQPAVNHHKECNRHHPEYFKDGYKEMNLIDLLEMICDWRAAGLRRDDSSVFKSIEIMQNRYGYSDELKQLLINTATYLGFD